MTDREQRGLAIAAVCRIEKKHDQWVVPSQTGNGFYRVNPEPANPFVPQCNCKDFEATGKPCKHVFAVQFVIQRESHADGSETTTKTLTITEKSTVAERSTYKQNWPAYDAAQTNEKRKFLELLHDLCKGIEEPAPRPGPGRKPIPLRDAVFSAVFKVYSTLSARRFMCDLDDAHAKGFISKVPHFTAISNALELEAVTPILRGLIVESARPLKSVEVDFAIDSSGFSTSRFVRWFDEKYGRYQSKHEWVKVHIACGVKTNVITDAVILDKHAGDCPQFKPLLQTTARNFTIREASADSAYSSYDNAEAVREAGGTPYIAYKANATAREGGVFSKMFHYYNFNREDFLSHYHKRSNVESTFSMVKAKFRDHVRSKTDTAMANEVYGKLLCHNICCLIQSMYELKIEPTFWGKEDVAPAAEIEQETVEKWDAMDWI